MKILGKQNDPLIPLVIGTQTASTNAFTGEVPLDELKHGQSIRYWLPYAGTSTGATLALTLTNGSPTDAIPIYYKGSTRLTTHYSYGSLILLTYLEDVSVNGTNYTGWWCGQDYNADTKTTTSSTNTSSKIYLVGATSQGSSKTTYSHDTVYVDTDGCVYSDGKKVLTSETALSKGTDATASKSLSFGGTFTAVTDTAVSGHQITDTTTTYTMPSDRLFTTLVPTGTKISSTADSPVDLNTTAYLKVGRYYCSQNTWAATIKNCPTSMAFMMEVYSPLSPNIDNETTSTYVYRLRKITEYNTGIQFIQYVGSSSTAGAFTYANWYVVPRAPFTLDTTDTNDGSATLGSATQPIYVGYDGTLAKCTYSLGKTVPSDAKFTDTNTTYSAGTGLSLSGTTFNHRNSVTAGSTSSSSGTLSHGGTLKLPKVTYDAQGHITGVTTTDCTLPADNNTDTKVTSVGNHYTPTADTSAALSVDASSTTSATWGSTDLVTGVNLQRDAKGHVTGITVDSIQMPANPNTDTDTKNTTGATDTSSKIFLVGATSQGTNPVTYSHDTAYVGTDGCVYSGSKKVSVDGHTHTADKITGLGYLNTHPEGAATIAPFINNDLAFLNKKGGSYSVYSTTDTDYTVASLTQGTISVTHPDNMFDGSPSYTTLSTTGSYVAVIDMTLHKTFAWGNKFYIDFGVAGWRAKGIAVYVMNSATETKYTLKASTTSNANSYWYASVSHSSTNSSGTTVQGFNKIRVVLSNFNETTSTSGKRIAQVGLLSYGSAGVTETFVSRGGCAGIYGDLIPQTTNNINLGSSSKKWKNIYATTFTGALSGNATSATKATQDGNGKVIADTYALKDHEHLLEDITDAPFETVTDTLTWDGNTDGLEYVDPYGGVIMYYRVSDAVPTLEDFTSGSPFGTILSNGASLHFTDVSATETVTGILSFASQSNAIYSGYVVSEDGVGVDAGGFTFNSSGIYVPYFNIDETNKIWFASLTISGYTGFNSILLKKELALAHGHGINDIDNLQNKLDAKMDNMDVDTTPTSGSTNLVTSGGVYDAMAEMSANGGYVLPQATSSTLGGVKVGSNITNSSGTISLTEDNVVSALGYTPSTAAQGTLAENAMPKSGGTFTGDVTFNNSIGISCKNTSGTALNCMFVDTTSEPTSSADALVIGYGNYANNAACTDIYGGGSTSLNRGVRLLVPNLSDGGSVGAVLWTSTSSVPAYFRPTESAKAALGSSTYKWYRLYQSESSVSTSDRREKENIKPLKSIRKHRKKDDGETEEFDVYAELFDRLEPVEYNFIEGEKRKDFGLIAQDVLEVMTDLGLEENELDLVHHDTWTDEETGEEKEAYGIAYENLIAVLIHEVQKLKDEVKELKQQTTE